jgi:hypothetical protein
VIEKLTAVRVVENLERVRRLDLFLALSLSLSSLSSLTLSLSRYQIELCVALEGEAQVNHEGMLHRLENGTLCERVFNLLLLHNVSMKEMRNENTEEREKENEKGNASKDRGRYRGINIRIEKKGAKEEHRRQTQREERELKENESLTTS